MTFEKLVIGWASALGIGFVAVTSTAAFTPRPVPVVHVVTKDAVPIYSHAGGKGFEVDVKLGGVPLRMVADTGATISSIPQDFANQLLSNGGAVTQGSIMIGLADGSRRQATSILIREFRIGNHVLWDVPATVSSGSPLLAFPVIDGIAPFTVNTRTGELIWHK